MSVIAVPGNHFYDSASKQAPAGKLIAAYVNGFFAYNADDLARYRARFMISVIRDSAAAQSARCLDIERFDATPADAPAFVQNRIAFGHHDALLYVNRSNRDEVVSLCDQQNLVLGRDYMLWVATLDGTINLPDMTGVSAIQFLNTPDYDESVVIRSISFVG